MRLSNRLRFVFPIVLPFLALLAGCGDDRKKVTAPEVQGVDEYVSRVSSLDGNVVARLHTDAAPTSGGGPAIEAEGTGALILGGSSQVNLTAPVPFTKVVVSVEDVAEYWEFELPQASMSTSLIITLGQDVPEDQFNLRYLAADASGEFGPSVTTPVTVRTVGTGEVQVSVSWDTASDVDLHVVDPAGEEIYYANTSSASGGVLDLDSNPACAIDGINNENVTWASGAPRGQYAVRVDYFSACGSAQTNYTVTVRVKGQEPKTFTGSLLGEGDQGGAGSGVPITTFSY